MAATGQTINDRLNAARYALSGQGLARTVCKATTEELIAPKKKHIDYLIACTNEPNVSIPQLANELIKRTQDTCWAVVFKALISIHHLMSSGNEKFTQYLATSNHSFNLQDFMDRTPPSGYTMSPFIRKYSKYINEKCVSYQNLAIDLCKIQIGKKNTLRTINMDGLSKTMPIVQSVFDCLLDFGAEAKDLNNVIILAAFRLLYKDLCRLYMAYQEAIINLLERYFKLSRKKTREALELYRNYLDRMDRVAAFLRIVDAIGLDKGDMPDLTDKPASILKLLEDHLAKMDPKKKGATSVTPEPEETEEAESSTAQSEDVKSVTEGIAKVEVSVELKQELSSAPKPTSSGSTTPDPPRPQPPKQTPPQKPARPIPKESPAKQSPQTSQPVVSSQPESQVKQAPERPAKPPSRPAPPSVASRPGPSDAKLQSPSKPPPPKPPSPNPQTVAPSQSRSQPQPIPQSQEVTQHAEQQTNVPQSEPEPIVSAPETSNTQSNTNTNNEANNSSDNSPTVQTSQREPEHEASNDDDHLSQYSCQAASNSSNQTSVRQNEPSPEVSNHVEGSNHVCNATVIDGNHVEVIHNDNNHDRDDDELPPPPPPIEDVDNNDQASAAPADLAEEHQVVEVDANQDSVQQPAINGSVNGSNGGPEV